MPLIQSIGRIIKPVRVLDAPNVELRATASGDYIQTPVHRRSGTYAFALEGSYFKASNATFNTAAVWNVATATTFSETQGSLTIRNSNAASGKDITIDYIRITVVLSAPSPTDIRCVMQIDNTVRYSSGGAALTPVNCNSGIANTTGAVIHFGDLTLNTAGGSARKLMAGEQILKASVDAANDVYLFKFQNVAPLTVSAPGVVGVYSMAPVCLPAGSNHSFVLHIYSTSQTSAPTAWVEIGYIER
jgi:hypothetical protein